MSDAGPDAMATSSASFANLTEDAQSSRIEWVHDHLRDRILTGELAPGMVMSQAALARELGISRSPIRESLRRLEAEGLIKTRHNQRVQVADLSIADMEEIYASRMVLEALAIRSAVLTLAPERVQEMRATLDAMRDSAQEPDQEAWSRRHSHFHMIALSGASPRLSSQILQLDDHAQRYRRLHMSQVPQARAAILDGDAALLGAIERRELDTVVDHWTRHLASAALSTIALVDPTYDARLIRSALHIVAVPSVSATRAA